MLHSDIYEIINNNLSCSNVGGRKNLNIRDHLFVLYGVLNEVTNGRAQSIDIQSMDVKKCFDEMGFHETHNDLWDSGSIDDKFSLISKLDEKCRVSVKTPCGVTKLF